MRPRKGVHELRREQTHVTGETDEINLVFPQRRRDLTIMFFAAAATPFNHDGL
jgi:hypothetical protein